MTDIRLITVGLSDYQREPSWRVPAATDSRQNLEDLLARHGVPAEDWTKHATTTKINKRLAKWIKQPDMSYVLYWVGHGEHTGFGYRLALSDSSQPLTTGDCLSGTKIFETLRDLLARRGDEHADNWVLLILDTCASCEGAWDIISGFDTRPHNVGIIGTTTGGAAFAGTFPRDLEQALAGFTGNDDGIPLRELVRRLEDGDNEVVCKFAANARLPSRVDAPPPTQATLDVYEELIAVLATAPPEIRNHFYAKAQGSEIGEPAWHFVGREAERRTIADWLNDAPEGMFVVSGIAGSGKSALLGMILATSDDAVLQALHSASHAPIPADLRPHDLSFDAVIHLSGHTIDETVAALAHGLGLVGVGDVDGLIAAAALRRADLAARTTVLLDALDEARDPFAIASLLRRLAALPGMRVIVGTRQSVHEDPDTPTPPDSDLLDALLAEPQHVLRLQRDPDAVRDYVLARLQQAAPTYPPGSLTGADAAATIAALDQPFLFARLAVHEIIADPGWLESRATLTQLLHEGHSGIFARAVRRLADSEPHVESLLHALTYARGNGFPRTDGIWATAASAISGNQVSDREVAKAIRLAAPYIMHNSEFGQGVYRLAHRTFAEWYEREDQR